MFKPRMHMKVSSDLRERYSWCKGPGGTSLSVGRRLAETRRAQLRGGEYGAKGLQPESAEAMVGRDRSNSRVS